MAEPGRWKRTSQPAEPDELNEVSPGRHRLVASGTRHTLTEPQLIGDGIERSDKRRRRMVDRDDPNTMKRRIVALKDNRRR